VVAVVVKAAHRPRANSVSCSRAAAGPSTR
jgi:hypothetical protein